MQTSPFSRSLLYPDAQPFFGIVESTIQALRLAHAARLGVIPRILRRLSKRERAEMIVSGAVFVFDVEESGIRRWTDGRTFSPSRIDGNFLVSLGYSRYAWWGLDYPPPIQLLGVQGSE